MTSPYQPDRRIRVGNAEMTRQEIVDALEANIISAKDGAADLLPYLDRLPSSPEQAHVVRQVQRIQGLIGGVLLQLVRALHDDDSGAATPR